jgi:RNA polymerase sigma-70 factor (ECF subfamily)
VAPNDSALDDASTISRILAGERDLFRVLVSAHKNSVFSTIRRQIHDHSTAEELAQEVFVKAFRGLSSFRGDSSFRTWVTRIAINTTHSYFSSKEFKQKSSTEALDPIKHDRFSVIPQQESRKLSLFKQAISTLSPKLQETLVLCGLEGKKYEEAAAILGVPIGTIRSRLNKARLLVRDAVDRALREEDEHEA